MAALSATTPTSVGVTVTPAAVSSSDTISAAQLGARGAYLQIINAGGSADTVAISDSGGTPAGNPGSSSGGSVPATTGNKEFFISPYAANPTTNVVTVTHTSTTSVTYVLRTLP